MSLRQRISAWLLGGDKPKRKASRPRTKASKSKLETHEWMATRISYGRRRPKPTKPLFNYLGKGVSSGLSDTKSDRELLEQSGLPAVCNGFELADQMGLAASHLRYFVHHFPRTRSPHYYEFEIPKRSGGERKIASPMPGLAGAQRFVLREILSNIGTHKSAHGFVSGCSIATSADKHVGQDVVLNVDLKEFFPSITLPRVAGLFRSLGYSGQVAKLLALICTACPRKKERDQDGRSLWVQTGGHALPQGACTSPAISNLIARSLDRRLSGLCKKMDWTYTRYADDLTFSASGEPAQRVGYLLHRIRGIARDESFQVNESKTRVQWKQQRQMVTGVVVNDQKGVPRKERRRIRAIFHRAQTEGLMAQNRDNHPDFIAYLEGMLGYIASIEPKHAEPYMKQLRALKLENIS
ncbi:MAG: reverse transcriptase family protein [Planctomycetota bacterium]